MGITEEEPQPPCKKEDRKRPDKVEYRRRQLNVRDEDVINRHLADSFQAYPEQDEELMTADDIALAMDETYHNEICTMLRKHEAL